MHFRSAVMSTLAARDQKDLPIVNLMKSRAGLTLLTTSPTQSNLTLTVITVLALWFCPYLETFGIRVLRNALSHLLPAHSLCYHLPPTHPAALPFPLGSRLGANLWKNSFT